MSFPRYPKYKDSGVEWLGEVPAHWDVTQLRYAISGIESGTSVNATDLPAEEGEVGVLKTSCVYRGFFEPAENKRVVPEEVGRVSCPLKKDSLIVSRMNTPDLIGAAGLVNSVVDGIYLPDRLWQISFNDRALPSFMYLWASSVIYRSQVQVACAGTSSSMQNLSQDSFRGFWLALPSPGEQAEISDFLKAELRKIDGLVLEQEKLIALLKEKRQAVISHAVTKGLDPDVSMKDSGIEWLGEVPAHWTMKRLKYISPFITVGIVVNPSDYVADEGLPFIYGGDISEGKIEIEGARRISPEHSARNSKTRLSAGDLLTVRVGAPGVTAVVPPECDGGNCASVMLVRQGNFDSRWLCYAMNSRMVRFQVEVVQYGAAQEQFNIAHAINFWVASPPTDEQQRIAEAIDSGVSRIEDLVAEAMRGIGLLHERRSALISAAVTGKIDVRKSAKSQAA